MHKFKYAHTRKNRKYKHKNNKKEVINNKKKNFPAIKTSLSIQ